LCVLLIAQIAMGLLTASVDAAKGIVSFTGGAAASTDAGSAGALATGQSIEALQVRCCMSTCMNAFDHRPCRRK
jgi:hypothetical protein